jgi:hypothetical protein
MDIYLATAHCRTNLCPIMEESPLESSESGMDSFVLSLKSSMLMEDYRYVRSLPKKYRQSKRLRMDVTSSESLSLAIDALVMSLKSELLRQDKQSKRKKRDKKCYNRWSSNTDSPCQRVKGGVESQTLKDVSPKRPCRY